MSHFFVHKTAVVDTGAVIGSGTKIWHFSHVFGGAVIGESCSFGQNTMVASGVRIGCNVKVQNNVAIYQGTIVEDDVFLGPSCVLTNISNPRSQVIRRGLYENTLIRRGATIGANATLVCGITLGRYSFIAAGTVVTRDVPDYAMIMGVPGKQHGWISRHAHALVFNDQGIAVCPESQLRYQLSSEDGFSSVHCLDMDEQASLPQEMSIGKQAYRDFRCK